MRICLRRREFMAGLGGAAAGRAPQGRIARRKPAVLPSGGGERPGLRLDLIRRIGVTSRALASAEGQAACPQRIDGSGFFDRSENPHVP
jgi:hypothetical protein